MLAVAADGALYVTVPAMGRVLRLADGNGDGDAGDAGEAGVVADRMTMPDLDGVHGIAIHDGRIYLATVKSVFSGALGAGGAITGLSKIVADLPDGGQHPNRTLGVGPDGKLYVSIGSTCNACPETNTEHASLLRIELTGAAASNPANPQHPMMARNPAVMMSPRVFASGLRNTIGFDWHPSTMALWGSDHGSDGLGDDIPPDEINLIEGGKSYGWPYCWGDRQLDPTMGPPSAMVSQQAYCTSTAAPMAVYGAHSAPIAFVFYRGTQFPTEFAGDAFVALHGSWNRSMPTGYKVVRVHFAAGAPAALPSGSVMQDFLTGFLIENGGAHFGRPAGLAVDATGALVISDDSNGVIYRVRHTSAADAGTD
jgi:glucose/arabinose dehydrogenase